MRQHPAPGSPIRLRTLTDGGQRALDVAREVAEFVAEARSTLDLALYDVRLPGEPGDVVAGAIRDAAARGVAVRIAYNEDHARAIPVPPPPRTRPEVLAELGVPLRAIPGMPDLMHHKFAVRDRAAVWTGSANWTVDSWERQENVLVVLESPAIAAAYVRDFEELWASGSVADSGAFETPPAQVGPARVRPWFCPGRGPALSHRIAEALGAARRRVRVASPVITAAPVLATLAQLSSDRRVDVAGVVDATQMAQVYGQWEENGNAAWKLPLAARVFERSQFSGKRSTPYAPDAVHDYMHAKVTVADDVAFVGSFNLSHSGEQNAENALEIHDPELAARLAGFVDEVRARYPPAAPPPGP